jgi:hypothetical protein
MLSGEATNTNVVPCNHENLHIFVLIKDYLNVYVFGKYMEQIICILLNIVEVDMQI